MDIDLPEIENVLINVPAPDGPFGVRALAARNGQQDNISFDVDALRQAEGVEVG